MSRPAPVHEPLPRRAYSVREVATSLGVPYIRALELVRSGQLRAIRTGQRYVIPAAALDDFLASAS